MRSAGDLRLRSSAVVVAHSLGCLAVLRRLAARIGSWRLGHLVLVSGFLERLPVLPELDAFIGDGCAVDGLRSSIDQVSVIRSDDDPIVPAGHTDRLAAQFGVRPTIVPGAGHFLAADGVTTLAAARDAVLAPAFD
ncbi:alpha/beta hydrolase [Nocardia sp. NPDC059180]|uniref:alpha/beta hydrolase n=1 Tax=Nocardia sp. NPDC059180 TaxID=3346761 RepID=UPI0036A8B5AA